MKALLEFNLPEDDSYFLYASKATELKLALDDIWQELRKLSKYSDLSEFKDKEALLEHIKEKYCEARESNGVNFD